MGSVRNAMLMALLLAAPGCGVTQVVDRAYDGQPILIRAPQPDEDDLEELHARFGVQTVVNLRGEHPGEGWFEAERRGVAAIGARWIHLKASGKSAPEATTVAEFLRIVEDPTNWPVLVHCQGGVHRTGLVSAIYRMQYQGWSPDRAIAEMEDCWFDWTVEDRDAIKRWLRLYRPDPERIVVRGPRTAPPAAVAAHGQGSQATPAPPAVVQATPPAN
jgi:tyrosine-protein phosphatase SIW14